MATQRYYCCTNVNCKKEFWIPRLFDALLSKSEMKEQTCPECSAPTKIRLKFPFGLDAGEHVSEVLDAFTSQQSWDDSNGDKVTFCPFIVVTRDVINSTKCIWMPYWHTVDKNGQKKIKYGQWAPYMDLELFNKLYKQALDKGYF